MEELLEATKPSEPFSWDKETDTPIGGPFVDFFNRILYILKWNKSQTEVTISIHQTLL